MIEPPAMEAGMRKLMVLYVGLVVSLGLVLGLPPAADAGIGAGTCCPCDCGDEVAFCVEGPADTEEFQAACAQSCGGDPGQQTCIASAQTGAETNGPIESLCDVVTACEGVPRGFPIEQVAPAVSTLGLAALLATLVGVGAWRMRKPAGAS